MNSSMHISSPIMEEEKKNNSAGKVKLRKGEKKIKIKIKE